MIGEGAGPRGNEGGQPEVIVDFVDLSYDDGPVIKSPFRSLREWGEWINANAQPTNPDGRRTVLVGSGGRSATRYELIAFVAEQNARYAREHGEE